MGCGVPILIEGGMTEIEGLCLVGGFVSESEEVRLLSCVDSSSWQGEIKRRVQHYGWRYGYRTRHVDDSAYLGPLPAWMEALAGQVAGVWDSARVPDQVIVNEYLPGQGISSHVDAPCFGPILASLSLGSDTTMTFGRLGEVRSLRLPSRSLLVLAGPARFEWTHEIAARKSDIVDNARVFRVRRVSLTFRTVHRQNG